MATLLIKNGILVNPKDQTETRADLFAADGIIVSVGGDVPEQADQVIDAAGAYVLPGLIDLHVHLRDPGQEYKEDVTTGGNAALHGGFTTIVAMPNTSPAADHADVIRYVENKAEATTKVHVLQAGALTRKMAGRELADLEGMMEAGCRAFSEDGKSVMNAGLAKQAMEIAAAHGRAILAHCEDINLVRGGVMNDDARAKELGLPGISNSVEDTIAARDIILAKETGVHLHLCHCSTKDSVQMVKMAREAGVSISAEVCPHHFSLCTEDIPGDDANYKMNPPLRSREDMEALRRGLAEDIMDVISTDHAPHTFEEKQRGFRKAPFGITGLETSAALTYTNLVRPGILTMLQMADKMSYRPAQILGMADRKGFIEPGAAADLTVFDPEKKYVIDPETFVSKGHNTPFGGCEVYGEIRATIVDGEVVYEA